MERRAREAEVIAKRIVEECEKRLDIYFQKQFGLNFNTLTADVIFTPRHRKKWKNEKKIFCFFSILFHSKMIASVAYLGFQKGGQIFTGP